MSEPTSIVPDGLPTLKKGKHGSPEGGTCVMEYVSILAGETFSDRPTCTDPMVARWAWASNDAMSDEGRQSLVRLVPRLIECSPILPEHTSTMSPEWQQVEKHLSDAYFRAHVVFSDESLYAALEAVLDTAEHLRALYAHLHVGNVQPQFVPAGLSYPYQYGAPSVSLTPTTNTVMVSSTGKPGEWTPLGVGGTAPVETYIWQYTYPVATEKPAPKYSYPDISLYGLGTLTKAEATKMLAGVL